MWARFPPGFRVLPPKRSMAGSFFPSFFVPPSCSLVLHRLSVLSPLPVLGKSILFSRKSPFCFRFPRRTSGAGFPPALHRAVSCLNGERTGQFRPAGNLSSLFPERFATTIALQISCRLPVAALEAFFRQNTYTLRFCRRNALLSLSAFPPPLPGPQAHYPAKSAAQTRRRNARPVLSACFSCFSQHISAISLSLPSRFCFCCAPAILSGRKSHR